MPCSRGSRSISEQNKTKIIKVNPFNPDVDLIRFAAEIIKNGGTVAFPTETVYGLGADALNPDAVRKVFMAKMRPLDNPVIVHIANREDVYYLAREVPEVAEKLIAMFWPGPLTLILKKSEVVPDITTAGLDTLSVRMPNNKVTLMLISEAKVPIVGPSANLSGKPSPTTPQHVIDDLAGRIDAVLDAGPTRIGVESTVLDITTDPPQILRPGGTPYEKLRKILGRVKLHPVALAERRIHIGKARSPGMKHRHYAPKAKVVVVEGELNAVIKQIQKLANSYMSKGKKVGIMATEESKSAYRASIVKSLGSRENLPTIAKNLFRLLREFDEEKVDIIIAEGIPLKGLGLAVMNRLRKASGFNILKA